MRPTDFSRIFESCGFCDFQHANQVVDFFGRQGRRILLGPRLLHGLRDPLFVERFQQIIDGVDFKRLHCILIKGGGEDDFGQRDFFVQQLLDDPKAVEAGHLHVEKNQVGIMLFDEVDSFEAVFALGDDVHVAGILQQVSEFVAGELFVVHDYGG